MVCGLVMGMVGRRTLSRAWSFSWEQKQRGKWCEMSEPLHSAQIGDPPISSSLTVSSDNMAESSHAPSPLCTQSSRSLQSSPSSQPCLEAETGLKGAAEAKNHRAAPATATLLR